MKEKLKKFINIIRGNEKVQDEFFEIEKSILKIHTISDLISTLLRELKSRFSLLYVGIVLIKDKIPEELLIERLHIEKKFGSKCKVLNKKNVHRFLLKNSEPRLDNTNLKKWEDFFPATIIKKAGSIAVVPLWSNNSVIGAICLADSSTGRYNPARATAFLERLGIIISICISNVFKHEELRFIAISDPLTGLSNRRHIYQVIDKELRLSTRYGYSFSLLYLDLNDFKIINDTFGHNVGDEYLKHVSKLLIKECREFDCVGRFGGDEFVIVLCRSGSSDAKIIKERINESLAKNPFHHNGKTLKISASIGLSSSRKRKNITADTLLKEADNHLYSEKEVKGKSLTRNKTRKRKTA